MGGDGPVEGGVERRNRFDELAVADASFDIPHIVLSHGPKANPGPVSGRCRLDVQVHAQVHPDPIKDVLDFRGDRGLACA